jgi:hypothetical protein
MVKTNIIGPIRVEMQMNPPSISIINKHNKNVIEYIDMDTHHEAERAFNVVIAALNEMDRHHKTSKTI